VTMRSIVVMPWGAKKARCRKPDGGARFLVGEVFGVGQPGVAVDRGVQVAVLAVASAGLVVGCGFGAAAAVVVDPPAATVGMRPTLTSRWTMRPSRRATIRRGPVVVTSGSRNRRRAGRADADEETQCDRPGRGPGRRTRN
jgi:hypothetical protein